MDALKELIQSLTKDGYQIGQAAKMGDEKARAVINFYRILHGSVEPVALTLCAAAYEDWKKVRPKYPLPVFFIGTPAEYRIFCARLKREDSPMGIKHVRGAFDLAGFAPEAIMLEFGESGFQAYTDPVMIDLVKQVEYIKMAQDVDLY